IYMRDPQKLVYVAKNIKDNEEYFKRVVGATISFDVGFREIVVLEKKIQIYYVNGLVDDKSVTEILKMLISINDDEVEPRKLSDIVKNRLVNQQVEPKDKLEDISDQILSGLIAVFIDGERSAYVVDARKYPGRQ